MSADAEPVVRCGDCGAPMVPREGRFGKFWGCSRWPECVGTHGAHPDGRPLGVPASAEVRALRGEAHAAFDVLWRHGGMRRTAAYRWLAVRMGRSEVHIGEMDADECRRVLAICRAFAVLKPGSA